MLLAFLAVGVFGPSNYLRGIVESDRALARTSRLKGLRWTYERTFSADALVLTTKVEKASDWLQAQEFKAGDKVFWDLNRAEISSKGEFGYTEGAWTVMRGTTYINGDFVRVWKKVDKDWKLILEAETTTDLPRVATGHVVAPPSPKKAKRKTKVAAKPAPTEEDVQAAITRIEANGSAKAYMDDAYFLRPKLPPSVGFSDDVSTNESKPTEEKFLVDKPADLACSFGNLSSETGSSPFLRIWRHSAGPGWQITLEYVGKLNPAAEKQDDSHKSKD